jgi:small-conductance mechanosensitive channel
MKVLLIIILFVPSLNVFAQNKKEQFARLEAELRILESETNIQKSTIDEWNLRTDQLTDDVSKLKKEQLPLIEIHDSVEKIKASLIEKLSKREEELYTWENRYRFILNAAQQNLNCIETQFSPTLYAITKIITNF